jgi:hypothetical protein
MSKQEFERFREFVFLDSSLQERLRRQTDRDLFIDNVIEIGNAYGFKITVEDIKKEMIRNRRTQE